MKLKKINLILTGIFLTAFGGFLGYVNDGNLNAQLPAAAMVASGIVLFHIGISIVSEKIPEPVGVKDNVVPDYTDKKCFYSTTAGRVGIGTIRIFKSGQYALNPGFMCDWERVNSNGTVPDSTVSYVKEWWL